MSRIAGVIVGLVVVASSALGQGAPGGGASGGGASGGGASVAPGQGAGGPARVPAPPPVLTRLATGHRDWTLVMQLRLSGSQPLTEPGTVNNIPTLKVRVDEATILFPMPLASSSHGMWDDRLVGRLMIAGRTVVDRPRLRDGYQAFERLAVWDVRNVEANDIVIQMEVSMTCYETRIDEARAVRMPWPQEWSPELAACLRPQLLIESDAPQVKDLLAKWMTQAPGGSDPRKNPPYTLAKYLAGRVVSHYQPASGTRATTARGRSGLNYSGVTVGGLNVEGAALAAANGRGPVLDSSNLLVAIYRAAGIPARLVVGYDLRAQEEKRLRGRPSDVQDNQTRAWVEFFLAGEGGVGGCWIPVDIQRQREFSSRPPNLNQRWQFFGHHEDLDVMCPMAFHWLPPTPSVNQGPVALWSWIPLPEGVVVQPDLRIEGRAAARRGDDPKRETPAPGGAPREPSEPGK